MGGPSSQPERLATVGRTQPLKAILKRRREVINKFIEKSTI